MDEASIEAAGTVKLVLVDKKGKTTPVAASVSYNPATTMVTLDPSVEPRSWGDVHGDDNDSGQRRGGERARPAQDLDVHHREQIGQESAELAPPNLLDFLDPFSRRLRLHANLRFARSRSIFERKYGWHPGCGISRAEARRVVDPGMSSLR